jgi:hypothetical protein
MDALATRAACMAVLRILRNACVDGMSADIHMKHKVHADMGPAPLLFFQNTSHKHSELIRR